MQMRWRRYVVKSGRRFMRASHLAIRLALLKTDQMHRDAHRIQGVDVDIDSLRSSSAAAAAAAAARSGTIRFFL
jgi:hypothetical protein